MKRKDDTEILDQDGIPDALVERAYRNLSHLHHWLGDTRHIVRALRQDSLPVRRIMDVGCGTGVVLAEVGRRLGVEVVGADIKPHASIPAPFPIIQADACHDPLPFADVAFSMHLGHHLQESDLAQLIRNVGRYCRRFIILDLVRHPLPLALFRIFIAPFIGSINARDGQVSVRRSYTASEFRTVVASALAGSGATFRQSVAPGYLRQVIDITYGQSAGNFSGSDHRRTRDLQCQPMS